MKGNKNLHTKDRYTIYLIVCERCNKYGADLDDRENSIELALENGFRNLNGENLCAECLASIYENREKK